MTRPRIAPCGSWPSPLSAPAVAAAALRLGHVIAEAGDIYWVEGRPGEGGRSVVARRSADGLIAEVTPATANVRTRVHEYGGAAYAVSRGVIYYSEFSDQRLYRLRPGGAREPLTPPGDWFYADCAIDPSRARLVSVREDHTVDGPEAVTTLVSVPLDGPPTGGDVIVSGHDFYSTPRFNPDGSRLSWLAWRHPQMPWDGTELWVADVKSDGRIEQPRRIAGGNKESIFQPGWSPQGVLYFVSDRTGWWNLYRLRDDDVEILVEVPFELGRPQWMLGVSTWAFADEAHLVAACVEKGRWRLVTVDVTARVLTPVATHLEPGDSIAATRTHAVFVGGSPQTADALVRVDLRTGVAETLRVASSLPISGDCVSVPEAIEFPTEGGLTSHAFYYAPKHQDLAPPPDERPPLIVVSHGGPTSATTGRLNLEIQYWTTRGFAVVDVNYGGSTGYGRTYRERLNGQWGVVDVDDCVNAARYLAGRGDVDLDRLIIRGKSAGGYTALAALTFHPEVFKAGASYYGIGDLELLGRDTHKFESRYLDRLIGPYPERRDVYRARSPIHSVDRLSCPIIFFQGLDDQVVPPAQARLMSEAMRDKGLEAPLFEFEGEQHGFRQAETIAHCLESELFFYARVFGFAPARNEP